MPLFEYRCNHCSDITEVLQKYNEPPPKKCMTCKSKDTMEKQVSLGSFQLKGGGWYKDLYSSKKSKDK